MELLKYVQQIQKDDEDWNGFVKKNMEKFAEEFAEVVDSSPRALETLGEISRLMTEALSVPEGLFQLESTPRNFSRGRRPTLL